MPGPGLSTVTSFVRSWLIRQEREKRPDREVAEQIHTSNASINGIRRGRKTVGGELEEKFAAVLANGSVETLRRKAKEQHESIKPILDAYDEALGQKAVKGRTEYVAPEPELKKVAAPPQLHAAEQVERRPRPTVASSPSAIAGKTSGDSKPRVFLSHSAADTEKVRAILISAGVSSVAAGRLTDDHVHQVQEAEGLRGGPRWESMARVAAELVRLDDSMAFIKEAAGRRSPDIAFADVIAAAEQHRSGATERHVAVGDADEIIESAKKKSAQRKPSRKEQR